MVEFALSLIFIFSLLSLIFDAGFAIWGYTALTETTAEIAADRAIHIDSGGGLCSSMGIAGMCNSCSATPSGAPLGPQALVDTANAIGRRHFDVFIRTDPNTGVVGAFGDVSFAARVQATCAEGDVSSRFIRVDATWNYRCIFCNVLGQDLRIRTSSFSQVEGTVPVDCLSPIICP